MAIKRSIDGKQFVVLWPTEAPRVTVISPNWCDKTTWYRGATRVVDEIADCANAPTYTQYQLDHTHLIDTYHGKISQETTLKDANNHSYRVVVKVNDVVKTEQDPHYGSGGDYTINYVTGLITFLSALQNTDEVKVTYHYATTSEFTLAPTAGKLLKIKRAEVQFGTNVDLTDSVQFAIYGLVDAFAPQLLQSNGGPYPSGTKIPIADNVTYKSMADYLNDSNGTYPVIPALGGSSWRGMSQEVIVLPWDYAAVTELKASAGMEIRIKLEHDTPFGGTYATATFYCLSEDEQ